MAKEDVNAIDEAPEAVLDEADAGEADDSTLPLVAVNVNSPEREKSKGKKGKRKKKKERKSKELPSSPTAAMPLSVAPPPENRKKRLPKGFRDKRLHRFRLKLKVRDKFFPHFITVNPGEDVVEVMTEFNDAYPRRNVCIVSAIGGPVSKAVFDNSPTPRTYEGRFKLLNISGGYFFEGNGESSNRKEGMLSALLTKDNGVLIGGTLVGPLIAADPIHIVVGSYRKFTKKVKTSRNVLISSMANLNINSASNDVVAAPEDVSANQNVEPVSEDSVVDLFSDITNLL